MLCCYNLHSPKSQWTKKQRFISHAHYKFTADYLGLSFTLHSLQDPSSRLFTNWNIPGLYAQETEAVNLHWLKRSIWN